MSVINRNGIKIIVCIIILRRKVPAQYAQCAYIQDDINFLVGTYIIYYTVNLFLVAKI